MKSIYLHSYKAQIKKKYKLLRNDIMKQPAQTHSQTNKNHVYGGVKQKVANINSFLYKNKTHTL